MPSQTTLPDTSVLDELEESLAPKCDIARWKGKRGGQILVRTQPCDKTAELIVSACCIDTVSCTQCFVDFLSRCATTMTSGFECVRCNTHHPTLSDLIKATPI